MIFTVNMICSEECAVVRLFEVEAPNAFFASKVARVRCACAGLMPLAPDALEIIPFGKSEFPIKQRAARIEAATQQVLYGKGRRACGICL